MDYKNTLNLPQTGFPMKADLVKREPLRLERWHHLQLYQKIQRKRAFAKETFVLHDGPPFANGEVHIGTALNKILKDIVVKYHNLRGKRAPYIPGWDCHGLPIEFKVTQEKRKAGEAAGDPVVIRKACEAYARKYIDLQRTQFKRLGVLGDWDQPYLTLNKEYEAEELRLFADIVEKGFVYRGKKPVYWSIPCRTALAEAEVEYQDHVSQSIYVKFPIAGQRNTFLLIWTTTPWTLPANLAVAFHPKLYYSVVRADGEAYILCNSLLEEVSAKCGWEAYEIERSLDSELLSQIQYQHPFIDRIGRLFPADFVEATTGTGFVHIAPGHGLEDYQLGRQHDLPIYSPVDDDGRFAHTTELPIDSQMPESLIGKSILEKNDRSEANEAVLALLGEKKALLHREDYHHSYPHCWRSKTPVVFRAMDQWFISIDHQGFRERALNEIGKVDWIPDWGRNRIESAVKNRPDWCISRQRTWGVPIPAFYDAEGEPILDSRVIRNVAALVEEKGSNTWFETPAAELWQKVKPSSWHGPEAVTKGQDTLDVWIDSGSSSRSVIMRRKELSPTEPDGQSNPSQASAICRQPWQADMYLEGSDQHRGWFQSSLLLSLAGNGTPPFKTVLTHGFMVDADREKISKSKQGQGGYIKPQTSEAYIKDWGADIIRLWVASQDFRNDIIVSEERMKKVAEMYRVIRNALRYQLSNLFDFDPQKDFIEENELTGLDRWILDGFASLENQVMEAYEASEFHGVYQKVSQFAAVELSAIYHDLVKDRLYTDPSQSHRRRSTQTTLHRLATRLCQMLSPILSFTTDEAWEFMPGGTDGESVHLSDWTPGAFHRPQAERAAWEQLFALREKVLPVLEKARQEKTIGKALEAHVTLKGSKPDLQPALDLENQFREILNVSQLSLNPTTTYSTDGVEVEVWHADGEKCLRCWHWERDVGGDSNHPSLCGRCVDAVQQVLQ